MRYKLVTTEGHTLYFYVLSCAQLYQSTLGGSIETQLDLALT
jgi:hypothetical protein